MASSLEGRYWLTPEGPIPINGREHGQIAKIKMLNLLPHDIPAYALIKDVYKPITSEHAAIHQQRGVSASIISFLISGQDPRIWALKNWRWVRVRNSQFNCWKFDDATLNLIRNSRNLPYWKDEEYYLDSLTEIWLNVESNGKVINIKALDVLDLQRDAKSLIKCNNPLAKSPRLPRTGRFFRA